MSKERQRARAARLAERERLRVERERRTARTARRQARWARATRWIPRRRRGKAWTRRTRAQRGGVIFTGLCFNVAVFLVTPSWALRIGALGLTAIALPALATATFDRSR
jgi:hypothetical protein